MIIYLGVPEKIMESKIKKIREIQEEIEQVGHAVILPIGGAGSEPLLALSDAVVMLEGWKDDEMSVEEVAYATRLGIEVYEYPQYPIQLHSTEARNPHQVQAFREIQGKMYRTHLKKNADYSPANILGTGEIGLVTRMWDKMARLLNLSGFDIGISHSHFLAPKQAKNESIEDTIMDLAVYSIIAMLYRAGKWGN